MTRSQTNSVGGVAWVYAGWSRRLSVAMLVLVAALLCLALPAAWITGGRFDERDAAAC